mgnify:CR=1 FL=1
MDLYLSSSPAIAPSHSLVIVAGGGRDLTWPSELIATHLLSASRGRLVQSLFHGGAAGPMRNRQMLERSLALIADLPLGAGLLVIAFPGSRGTASLVDQARRLSRRSAIPIEVLEISSSV